MNNYDINDSSTDDIIRKKIKNDNIKIFNKDHNHTNILNEKKAENIIDVTSEIRVDVLRLLTIIKKMENEKIDMDNKLKHLSHKVKDLEELVISYKEKTSTVDTNSDSTCGHFGSLTENIRDVNEYEIKLDKFKNEMNDKFIKLQKKWNDEFAIFKQNIIEISRIKK